MRDVRDGRSEVLTLRVVEGGWRDSGVVAEFAVVGRVDGGDAGTVVVFPSGTEGAVQKVEVEKVESADWVWLWPLSC